MNKFSKIIIFILFIFLLTGCSGLKVKRAKKYLTQNGYTCEKGEYSVGPLVIDQDNDTEEAVMCEKQEDNYTIQYVLRRKGEFSIEMTVIDTDKVFFRIGPWQFAKITNKNRGVAFKKGEFSEAERIAIRLAPKNGDNIRDGVVEPVQCLKENYDYLTREGIGLRDENCKIAKDHLDIVNKSIEEYMALYKTIKADIR